MGKYEDTESVKKVHDSNYHEKKIKKSLLDNKVITNFQYSLSATSIILPKRKGYSERRVFFSDIRNTDKCLLYKVIIAAYNYAYFDPFAAPSSKALLHDYVPLFVQWINNVKIKNRYTILKDYEAHRFDVVGNHGGLSSLSKLKVLFTYALDYSSELTRTLKSEQIQFLNDLRKTKISPNINKSQASLASYFGHLDWLRSDDIGIGNNLYQVFASPKFTVNSLKVTSATIILELYNCKLALKGFFRGNDFGKYFLKWAGSDELPARKRKEICGQFIYKLLTKYHEIKGDKVLLRNALELVLLSNATNVEGFHKLQSALINENIFNDVFYEVRKNNSTKLNLTFCHRTFVAANKPALFNFKILQNIASSDLSYPITFVESLMFSWLMASLTVQPSDIPKLKHNSFRMLKVGGEVTDIECEYFKSRAKIMHTTRSISTHETVGRSIYLYISQQENRDLVITENVDLQFQRGIGSITSSFEKLLGLSFVNSRITEAHYENGKLPLVIPTALVKLIKYGKSVVNIIPNSKNTPLNERKKMVIASSSPSPVHLFGLQLIKNSAVHAYSDPYTLHYLINRNSHSNQTEKSNYLNEQNEEWMNSSGRITRSVMLDLINNVYDLGDDKDYRPLVQKFNQEFMAVSSGISYKAGDMLSRLKVITKQEHGKINEVGVLSYSNKIRAEFEPIYVLDSPVTVFKINNFLHEFKNNYRKLLCRNPDYLYQTVMPTVEWMELVLKKLSKSSIVEGEDIFKKMKENNVSVKVFHSI